MVNDVSYVRQNLEAVLADIEHVAAQVGCPPPALIPVTKSATDEEVLALTACGVAAIAENRVPNYRARRDLLASHHLSVPLHLIGSLQTNKVKYIARDVALIQSLDSLHLAKEIARRGQEAGRRIPVLIEINSGREPNKSGLFPEELPAFCGQLRRTCPDLPVVGLMTMGPVCKQEEEYRPFFAEVRTLLEKMRDAGGFATDTPQLSMGMSDSYHAAIREGATMVRIGHRLFAKNPADRP